MASTARIPLVQIGGVISQLPAGDYILAPANSPDEIVATNSNASPITIGQVVYIKSDGTVDLARGNAVGTARGVGLVMDASVAASASANIAVSGIVTGMSGLTAGSTYFLSSATAGLLTTTAPSAVGTWCQKMGIALSATTFMVNPDEPIAL